MGSNLAEILTETAAEHGDRPALKLDDTVAQLRAARRGRRAGRRRCCRSKGVEPGDRVGMMLPERPVLRGRLLRRSCAPARVVVPMNPLLKGREVAVLPRGLRAPRSCSPGSDWSTRPRKAGAEEAGAELHPRRARRVRGAARPQHEPDDDVADRDGRRHRRDPLHLGHHRHAQGRRAHPRTTCATNADDHAPRRSSQVTEEDVVLGACRCSTPSGRPAGSTPRSPPAPA